MELEYLNTVYCSTCLSNTIIDKDNLFKCSNKSCICPYHFKAFNNQEDALVFFDKTESWRPKYIFFKDNTWFVTFNNDPMQPFILNSILDLINFDSLRLIEAGLSEEINSSVTIIDSNGIRIDCLKYETESGIRVTQNCSDYCKMIRSTSYSNIEGDNICKKFDMDIFNKVKNNVFNDQWYMCWAGLIDYVIPLYIDKIFMGAVFSGQKRLFTDDISLNDKYNNSLKEVSNILNIPSDELKLLSSPERIKYVTVEEIEQIYIPKFEEVVNRIRSIAENSYRNIKTIHEDLFLDEIAFHLEYSNEGSKGIENLSKVLNRLCDFFSLEECLFLFSYDRNQVPYKIISNGTNNKIYENGEKQNIKFNSDIFKRYDTITLFELTNQKYKDDYDQIQNFIPKINIKEIIVCALPLVGTNHGVLIFVNPLHRDGFPNTEKLTGLEKAFLRKLSLLVRDKLNNALSFSLVLQKLGHELGSSVQSLILSEENILSNIGDTLSAYISETKNIR